MKKIAVLIGGTSHERDVSLESGRNVVKALSSLNIYDVIPVELKEDNLSSLPRDVYAVYIALHGGWGENGGVQKALDEIKIPYTGPGARASRIAMDKIETKEILFSAGVSTAPWKVVKESSFKNKEEVALKSPFGYPVVVKVPRDGSSVGVFLAKNDDEYIASLEKSFPLDNGINGEKEVLVEQYIPGREMTVGIIDGEALPAIEIIAKGGWYGFEEKYESEETKYPFLSSSANPLDDALEVKLQVLAKKAYDAIGCRGVTRIDFRVSPNGEAFVLELNTSPGFTAHSLVPKAGMHTGLTFAQVCDKILSSAKHD